MEEDPLFKKTLRETDGAQDQRTKVVLDDVFSTDKNTWISLSSHSGEISSLLRGEYFNSGYREQQANVWVVLKHRVFRLGTGQVIPVLIKAEILEGEAPHEEPKPWMTITPCPEPPAPTV